jgi:hypothetical protein
VTLTSAGVTENFLEHYGVKGMKWGVRRDSLSRADRKAANTNLKKQLGKYERNSGNLEAPISTKTYKSLSDQPVVMQKGAEFVRITTRKNEKLRDLAWASHLPEDVTAYRSLIPSGGAFRNTRKENRTSYEHVFAAAKTLRGPSEKARVDAFIDLMDRPAIALKNGKTVTGREYLAKNGYRKEVKQLNSVKLGLAAYKQMTAEQTDDTPMGAAYFSNLRSKGYDFVADDNDRGLLTREPLILMNTTGSTIKPVSVRQLSKEEVAKAQQELNLPNKAGVHK